MTPGRRPTSSIPRNSSGPLRGFAVCPPPGLSCSEALPVQRQLGEGTEPGLQTRGPRDVSPEGRGLQPLARAPRPRRTQGQTRRVPDLPTPSSPTPRVACRLPPRSTQRRLALLPPPQPRALVPAVSPLPQARLLRRGERRGGCGGTQRGTTGRVEQGNRPSSGSGTRERGAPGPGGGGGAACGQAHAHGNLHLWRVAVTAGPHSANPGSLHERACEAAVAAARSQRELNWLLPRQVGVKAPTRQGNYGVADIRQARF
nr:translation initiation factor IF-2-like [Symphalangus syndactylus]